MRNRLLLALVAAVAASASTATAQQPDELRLDPTYPRSDQTIRVTGTCSAPGKHLVTSPGFTAPIPLNSEGKIVNRRGNYVATLKCGKKTLTADFQIYLANDVVWYMPTRVNPGDEIAASVFMYECSPTTPVTSPGFVAPIQWTERLMYGRLRGTSHVIKDPGTYTATFKCAGGKRAYKKFTITGTPTVKPKPGKPQVPQKPRGAVETGGGATALLTPERIATRPR